MIFNSTCLLHMLAGNKNEMQKSKHVLFLFGCLYYVAASFFYFIITAAVLGRITPQTCRFTDL